MLPPNKGQRWDRGGGGGGTLGVSAVSQQGVKSQV